MSDCIDLVVDATALTGVAAHSGIGTYIRGILGALGARADIRVRALCETAADLPEGIEKVPIGRATSRLLPDRPRAHVIEHSARLPADLLRLRRGGDVFHNPGYHAPAGVKQPWVQTLLDVIPLVVESPDTAALRSRWKRFGPRYKHASAIVAISRHAADDGIRLLGLDPARIHVARLGVDGRFSPGPRPDEERDRPYILVVSEYSRRKGFAEAFSVIGELAEAGYPHRLLVAGRIHGWAEAELHRLRTASRRPDRIEILGFVPDLVGLYRGASCFLMSSRYEGFGLPAVEAMACGTPVVAFSNSALTEVVGDGGQLVADGDVAAMTRAVRLVLDNGEAAAEWRARGIARARSFTWTASAEAHMAAYSQAAA